VHISERNAWAAGKIPKQAGAKYGFAAARININPARIALDLKMWMTAENSITLFREYLDSYSGQTGKHVLSRFAARD
jgi:hypothetical protein